MPKFRKKPIVVEAEQWFPGKAIAGVIPSAELEDFAWIDTLEDGHIVSSGDWIDTLEGGHIVSSGDWIITGIEGEKCPCKPSVFEATYEPLSPQQEKGEDIELTDSEWMSLIDADRDGLPRCCGNISSLRDAIIRIARDGGWLNHLYVEGVLSRYEDVVASHEVGNLLVLQKFIAQVRDWRESQ